MSETNQYECLCEECKCVLSEDVAIQCLVNADGDEMTLCDDCWQWHEADWRADGWKLNDEEEDESSESESEDDKDE
jgi:hypothetical protein